MSYCTFISLCVQYLTLCVVPYTYLLFMDIYGFISLHMWIVRVVTDVR